MVTVFFICRKRARAERAGESGAKGAGAGAGGARGTGKKVPEMATATSSLVSAAGPSENMESDTKIVADATPVTLQDEAAPVPTEDIKVDDEPKPKTIGAEVAALLEEVEADLAAESVLRNKVEKDIEKYDVRKGSTFLTEIDDH